MHHLNYTVEVEGLVETCRHNPTFPLVFLNAQSILQLPVFLPPSLQTSLPASLLGWEYRHWDSLLHLLAVTTRAELAQRSAGHPSPSLASAAQSAPPAYSLIAAATSSTGSLVRTSSVSTPNTASSSSSAASATSGASAAASASAAVLPSVEDGWAAVFASGRHELVEVWAEGQHVEALKLLLVTASKVRGGGLREKG